MKITNRTKNKVIVEKAELVKTFWKQAKGLMFRKTIGKGEGMLFAFGEEGFHGIWMLFMRFPIDIIFLDAKKRVVTVHENARPLSFSPWTWKVYYPQNKAKYVLELRSGAVREKRIEAGDLLDF